MTVEKINREFEEYQYTLIKQSMRLKYLLSLRLMKRLMI